MDWLNYHHLYYFWIVAREGSISKACERLHLAQPTISAQIQALERALKEKLFHRTGRRLVLTETGQLVFRYADEIFSVGRELQDTLRGRPSGRPMRFAVGVSDALPKSIAFRLLEPAVRMGEPVHIVCREGGVEQLIADLALHQLDLVLCETPLGPGVKVRAIQHDLGDSAVSILGTPELVARYQEDFPRCLEGAPFLLPAYPASLRRALEHWLDSEELHINLGGEFDDSALLKAFAQSGIGFIPTPTVVADEVMRQYNLATLATLPNVRIGFYALTIERKIKHPATMAVIETARRQLGV
jgi:LysR family transcriptional activator of nhaA